MKAYGVPRTKDVEYPDLLDIVTYGMKSSTGQVAKYGQTRGLRGSVKPRTRQRKRTALKRAHRTHLNASLRAEIDNLLEKRT
uniref:Uncharacterized protein n=1 Tax=Candidatus Kentrum sp. TC TaxID=2126339 RepID=A0A451A1L0_9GAMM|nr:MAG: hypothetical protein BECKTC1821F_GA0114240_103824 [Candidatus Kentron sp. TC]